MKKLVSISLLLFYLFGITGIGITSHYCCGEIASVQLTYNPAESHMTSANTQPNCCDNITHFFKIHDAQQAGVSDFSFNPPTLQIPLLFQTISLMTASEQNVWSHSSITHSPPWQATRPLFLRHEVFLI
jgi:hypothetical protein